MNYWKKSLKSSHPDQVNICKWKRVCPRTYIYLKYFHGINAHLSWCFGTFTCTSQISCNNVAFPSFWKGKHLWKILAETIWESYIIVANLKYCMRIYHSRHTQTDTPSPVISMYWDDVPWKFKRVKTTYFIIYSWNYNTLLNTAVQQKKTS